VKKSPISEEKDLLIHGFKYRSTKAIMATMNMPAIFFRYEISPVKLRYTYSDKDLVEFLISMCAIFGGIFTVAGILESLVTNSASKVLSEEKKTKQAAS
jgi:hypothetical protein